MQPARTDVLIVGAGPVGLTLAVLLAEAGVQAVIMDHETGTAARSYACALHPSTLRLLQRVGLASTLIGLGRKIQTAAFYKQGQRQAEISFAQPGEEFPYLLVLPQSTLEGALEETLRSRFGGQVLWRHRVDDLEPGADSVEATVEELEDTSTGYIVPHWELAVKRRVPFRCRYLAAADGPNSLVRRRLGLDLVRVTPAQHFAAYEFSSGDTIPDELRIAIDEKTINTLWPLPGDKSRWTFQMERGGPEADDFPTKERQAVRLASKVGDEEVRAFVESTAHQRAPWFNSRVKEVTWCTRVSFEGRYAASFGRDNCVLVGDAAHQTGPVGAQSLNAGMHEAAQLASAFAAMFRNGRLGEASLPQNALESTTSDQREFWRDLLGSSGTLSCRSSTSSWIKENCSRLLPCLPGLGADLRQLAGQLGLDFPNGENTGSGTK